MFPFPFGSVGSRLPARSDPPALEFARAGGYERVVGYVSALAGVGGVYFALVVVEILGWPWGMAVGTASLAFFYPMLATWFRARGAGAEDDGR